MDSKRWDVYYCKNHSIVSLRELFRRVFTQHAAVAILHRSATIGWTGHVYLILIVYAFSQWRLQCGCHSMLSVGDLSIKYRILYTKVSEIQTFDSFPVSYGYIASQNKNKQCNCVAIVWNHRKHAFCNQGPTFSLHVFGVHTWKLVSSLHGLILILIWN